MYIHRHESSSAECRSVHLLQAHLQSALQFHCALLQAHLRVVHPSLVLPPHFTSSLQTLEAVHNGCQEPLSCVHPHPSGDGRSSWGRWQVLQTDALYEARLVCSTRTLCVGGRSCIAFPRWQNNTLWNSFTDSMLLDLS